MGKKKTHEEFMRDFKERQPDNFEKIEVLGVYEKTDKKIKCKCKIDRTEWEIRPNDLLRGHGCPKCGIKKCANSNTKTHEQFLKKFKEKQPKNFDKIEVLEKYEKSNGKIKCRCKIDGFEWKVTPDSLLNSGNGCPKCAGKNKTHEEFIKEFKEKYPENFEKIEILGIYEKSAKKIKCKCKIDEFEWEVKPNDLLNGRGCPKCGGKMKKTHEDFIKDFKINQPESFERIEVLGKYEKAAKKIKCKCKIDGFEWNVVPSSLLIGIGCPKCAKTQTSLFEQVIYEAFREVLGENKILHRDKSIIGKELDIYIPELKVAYEPGGWNWHSNKTENDYDKYLLCKEKGVKLITIYDGMNNDFGLEFEYNVIKYKNNITKEEMKNFIEKQFKELNLNNKIEWEKIFKKAKNNCSGITHEQFLKKFKEKQPKNFDKIEVLEKYEKSNEKIKCRCKIDGFEWKVTPDNLLNGHGCPKCAGKNKTHEDFIKNFKEKYPENFEKIEILGIYEKSAKKIKCKCKIDEFEWMASPSSLLNGHGCPKCAGKNKTHEDFIKNFKEKYPENFEKIEILGIYKKDNIKLKCKCKIDEYEWEVAPRNLLDGRGCPVCGRKKCIETRRRNAELKKIQEQKEKEEKEN